MEINVLFTLYTFKFVGNFRLISAQNHVWLINSSKFDFSSTAFNRNVSLCNAMLTLNLRRKEEKVNRPYFRFCWLIKLCSTAKGFLTSKIKYWQTANEQQTKSKRFNGKRLNELNLYAAFCHRQRWINDSLICANINKYSLHVAHIRSIYIFFSFHSLRCIHFKPKQLDKFKHL